MIHSVNESTYVKLHKGNQLRLFRTVLKENIMMCDSLCSSTKLLPYFSILFRNDTIIYYSREGTVPYVE